METNVIDDLDTTKENAQGLLEKLSGGFNGSMEETAIALGRTPQELEGILAGSETADEDLVMKIRGVAEERGIPIE